MQVVKHRSALGLFILMMFLLGNLVYAATVTVTIKDPDGNALSNATVKIIGKDFDKELKTNETGVVVIENLTTGNDYLLVAKGDNFIITAMLLNVTDNTTKLIDASTFNYTDVKISPTELTVNVKFAYKDYKDFVYEFDAPMKLYTENNGNFTLEFPKEIVKGLYSYTLKEITYNNETITNTTVELTSSKNYEVNVEYTKTVNTLIALLLVAVVLVLLALALRAGKSATAVHQLRNKFEFVRRK